MWLQSRYRFTVSKTTTIRARAHLGAARADAALARELPSEKPLRHWRAELAAVLFSNAEGPQVVEFLRHLQRHTKGRILIIGDGAAMHRCKLATGCLATTGDKVIAERLPPCAPELNPAESMWAHLKCHKIANLITTQAWELSLEATAALRRMRRRPSIIAACFSQAELWP